MMRLLQGRALRHMLGMGAVTLAAAAAACAGSAASSASAVTKPVRFTVTVNVAIVRNWTAEKHLTASSCGVSSIDVEGSGHEEVLYATTKPLLLTARPATRQLSVSGSVSAQASVSGRVTEAFTPGAACSGGQPATMCQAASALAGEYWATPTSAPCADPLRADTSGCAQRTALLEPSRSDEGPFYLGYEKNTLHAFLGWPNGARFLGCPTFDPSHRVGGLDLSARIPLSHLASHRVFVLSGLSSHAIRSKKDPSLHGTQVSVWLIRFARLG